MALQGETETEKWVRRKPWPVEGDRPTVSGDASSLEPQGPEQRLRAALGVAGGGPIPRVSEWALSAYYDYLAGNLCFPFVARYWQDVNPLESVSHVVSVDALVNPRQHRADLSSGLACVARLGEQTLELPLAELELSGGTANARLVEDYWYWFWNWRPDVR